MADVALNAPGVELNRPIKYLIKKPYSLDNSLDNSLALLALVTSSARALDNDGQ